MDKKTARQVLSWLWMCGFQGGSGRQSETDVDDALKELRGLLPKKMEIKYGDEEYRAGWNDCLKAVREVLK